MVQFIFLRIASSGESFPSYQMTRFQSLYELSADCILEVSSVAEFEYRELPTKFLVGQLWVHLTWKENQHPRRVWEELCTDIADQ